MRRRSRAGGEPVKARRRKAMTLKRGNGPKTVRGRSSSPTGQEAEVVRLTRELNEAVEQQTATAEILRVISSSPGDLPPVFEAILENSTRICEATFGNLWLREGDKFRIVAMHGGSPEYREYLFAEPLIVLTAQDAVSRVVSHREVIQIDDISKAPTYGMRMRIATIKIAKARTLVGVPMLKDNEVVEIIAIYRQEVRPFTAKQIELVQNFASQAVIAIENARLLNELRVRTTDLTERTADLTEALEQQTATADVLKVISRSTFDLQSVLNTLVKSAARLCAADNCGVQMREGDEYRIRAHYGATREAVQYALLHPLRADRSSATGRVALEGKTIHIPDVLADPEFHATDYQQAFGARTTLGVPLLRDGTTIGVFTLGRHEVKPFTDKQIELVTTFADQAVIAIENARLFEAEQQRTRELTKSLQQQSATADVLKVVSRATFELQMVLDMLTESAAQLCAADMGILFQRDGDLFRLAANYGFSPEAKQYAAEHPIRLDRGTVTGRAALEDRVIHIPDVLADPEFDHQRAFGYRTSLGVPLLREGSTIGVFVLVRDKVNPFTDKQVELVTTFADQAVIAIENTRLLNELRESLQQQTATADVLKVISRSAFDLQTVLDTLVRSAVLLCEADMAAMHEQVGTGYHEVATHGFDQGYKQLILATLPFEAARGSVLGRTVQERRIIHVPDVLADPEYTMLEHQRRAGFRAVLGVPLLREGNPVGAIVLMRKMVRPFTDKQIELATTFADQAAIAIENVRLLSELQQRTADLTESLEQQTATSEVLQVISRSPGDLQPVFASMLENAVRICDATFGNIYRWDGELLHLLAAHNTPPALAEFRRRSAIRPSSFVRSMVETKTTVHILDLAAHEDYTDKRVPNTVSAVELGGVRTFLTVPMVRENELIGSFSLYRQEVRPFSDKEIGLVTNFAAQAVIAIENARLLSELRLRTDDLGRSVEELRALGEVSQAVNSTLDLETVLTTVVSRAVHLSRTDAGAIYVFDDERQEFRLHATYGMSETMITAIADQRIGLGDAIGAATALRKPIQVPDIRNEPTSPVNEIIVREGYRGILVIPLLRPDHIVGALVVRRKMPGEFANSTIDLLQTFADQSVVAIQNARLFESVETRTRELAKSLGDLRTAQDRLVQTEKLASLGQLTAGIAHEIKNPLNFVNNFSAVSVELIDELREALGGAHLDNKLRAEISEIADTLQSNLDKVVQHGKRADAIVKNMLLHSRQGSGEHRPVDINALVDESLNLAYHGARAEKQGFTITLERSFDPAAGEVDLFPQEIMRALLNLISNGFYAASKRKAEANGGDYEPTLAAATKNLGDRVEIRIRDNGTGIPPEVKEKLFSPFFTTKPAGEGTGLGLSISHDIIVKQHGGSIEVDTKPGEFTEFRIILPRAGAFVAGR